MSIDALTTNLRGEEITPVSPVDWEDWVSASAGASARQVPFTSKSMGVPQSRQRLGDLDAELVEEIVADIAIAIDYRP